MKKIVSFLFALIVLLSPVLAYADNRAVIVHCTETGDCYHSAGCSYLKSDIPLTLEEAVKMGLRPCSRCNPPRPDFPVSVTPIPRESSGSSSSGSTRSAPATIPTVRLKDAGGTPAWQRILTTIAMGAFLLSLALLFVSLCVWSGWPDSKIGAIAGEAFGYLLLLLSAVIIIGFTVSLVSA